MSTDTNNLKICRITEDVKEEFNSFIPSNGSIYWDETNKSIIVGDGIKEGGIAIRSDVYPNAILNGNNYIEIYDHTNERELTGSDVLYTNYSNDTDNADISFCIRVYDKNFNYENNINIKLYAYYTYVNSKNITITKTIKTEGMVSNNEISNIISLSIPYKFYDTTDECYYTILSEGNLKNITITASLGDSTFYKTIDCYVLPLVYSLDIPDFDPRVTGSQTALVINDNNSNVTNKITFTGTSENNIVTNLNNNILDINRNIHYSLVNLYTNKSYHLNDYTDGISPIVVYNSLNTNTTEVSITHTLTIPNALYKNDEKILDLENETNPYLLKIWIANDSNTMVSNVIYRALFIVRDTTTQIRNMLLIPFKEWNIETRETFSIPCYTYTTGSDKNFNHLIISCYNASKSLINDISVNVFNNAEKYDIPITLQGNNKGTYKIIFDAILNNGKSYTEDEKLATEAVRTCIINASIPSEDYKQNIQVCSSGLLFNLKTVTKSNDSTYTGITYSDNISTGRRYNYKETAGSISYNYNFDVYNASFTGTNGWTKSTDGSKLNMSGKCFAQITGTKNSSVEPYFLQSIDDSIQANKENTDILQTGRTIEVTFKVSNVSNPDLPFFKICPDGASNTESAGIYLYPSYGYVRIHGDNTVYEGDPTNKYMHPFIRYATDKKITISIVIDPENSNTNTNDGTITRELDSNGNPIKKPYIYMYINGELSKLFSFTYPSNQLFDNNNGIVQISSEGCVVELYAIRIYNAKLTKQQLFYNYVTDFADTDNQDSLALANNITNNDNDMHIMYSLAREKYPCMLIAGTLPTVKGGTSGVQDKMPCYLLQTKPNDKSFIPTIPTSYELDDSNNVKLVPVEVSVQGTSSAAYNRKNFKIKFSKVNKKKQPYQIFNGNPNASAIEENIPSVTVFCAKADYMSSDGANTANANYWQPLLRKLELTPSQKEFDEKGNVVLDDDGNEKWNGTLTSVMGFYSLMFHCEDEETLQTIVNYDSLASNDEKREDEKIKTNYNKALNKVEFIGRYNINLDKGSTNALGLEYSNDVEKWEYLQNSNPICSWKTADFTGWEDALELSYNSNLYDDAKTVFDKNSLTNNMQLIYYWLTTRANFIKTSDENGNIIDIDNDKLTLYKKEFEKHFDLNHTTAYFITCETALIVDNLEKNLFLTCYDNYNSVKSDLNTYNSISTDDDKNIGYSYHHLLDSCRYDENTIISVGKDENGENIEKEYSGLLNLDSLKNLSDSIWINTNFPIFYPTLYDMDSCLGVDNTGRDSYNYNANLIEVSTGKNSIFWKLFYYAYKDKIAEIYEKYRSYTDIPLTVNNIQDAYVTKASQTLPIVAINADEQYKYEDSYTKGFTVASAVASTLTEALGDVAGSSNEQDGLTFTNAFSYLAQGTKAEQHREFFTNRINLLDAKYNAGTYQVIASAASNDNSAYFRIKCNKYDSNKKNDTYKITNITTVDDSRVNLYLSNSTNFVANKGLESTVVTSTYDSTSNTVYNISKTPNEKAVPNDYFVYLWGTKSLRSLTLPSDTTIFSVTKTVTWTNLKEASIGSISIIPSKRAVSTDTPTDLTSITTLLYSAPLLQKLELPNCTNITEAIDLSKYPALKYIDISDTKTSEVSFIFGTYLQTALLPDTIRSISLVSAKDISTFDIYNTTISNSSISKHKLEEADLNNIYKQFTNITLLNCNEFISGNTSNNGLAYTILNAIAESYAKRVADYNCWFVDVAKAKLGTGYSSTYEHTDYNTTEITSLPKIKISGINWTITNTLSQSNNFEKTKFHYYDDSDDSITIEKFGSLDNTIIPRTDDYLIRLLASDDFINAQDSDFELSGTITINGRYNQTLINKIKSNFPNLIFEYTSSAISFNIVEYKILTSNKIDDTKNSYLDGKYTNNIFEYTNSNSTRFVPQYTIEVESTAKVSNFNTHIKNINDIILQLNTTKGENTKNWLPMISLTTNIMENNTPLAVTANWYMYTGSDVTASLYKADQITETTILIPKYSDDNSSAYQNYNIEFYIINDNNKYEKLESVSKTNVNYNTIVGYATSETGIIDTSNGKILDTVSLPLYPLDKDNFRDYIFAGWSVQPYSTSKIDDYYSNKLNNSVTKEDLIITTSGDNTYEEYEFTSLNSNIAILNNNIVYRRNNLYGDTIANARNKLLHTVYPWVRVFVGSFADYTLVENENTGEISMNIVNNTIRLFPKFYKKTIHTGDKNLSQLNAGERTFVADLLAKANKEFNNQNTTTTITTTIIDKNENRSVSKVESTVGHNSLAVGEYTNITDNTDGTKTETITKVTQNSIRLNTNYLDSTNNYLPKNNCAIDKYNIYYKPWLLTTNSTQNLNCNGYMTGSYYCDSDTNANNNKLLYVVNGQTYKSRAQIEGVTTCFDLEYHFRDIINSKDINHRITFNRVGTGSGFNITNLNIYNIENGVETPFEKITDPVLTINDYTTSSNYLQINILYTIGTSTYNITTQYAGTKQTTLSATDYWRAYDIYGNLVSGYNLAEVNKIEFLNTPISKIIINYDSKATINDTIYAIGDSIEYKYTYTATNNIGTLYNLTKDTSILPYVIIHKFNEYDDKKIDSKIKITVGDSFIINTFNGKEPSQFEFVVSDIFKDTVKKYGSNLLSCNEYDTKGNIVYNNYYRNYYNNDTDYLLGPNSDKFTSKSYEDLDIIKSEENIALYDKNKLTVGNDTSILGYSGLTFTTTNRYDSNNRIINNGLFIPDTHLVNPYYRFTNKYYIGNDNNKIEVYPKYSNLFKQIDSGLESKNVDGFLAGFKVTATKDNEDEFSIGRYSTDGTTINEKSLIGDKITLTLDKTTAITGKDTEGNNIYTKGSYYKLPMYIKDETYLYNITVLHKQESNKPRYADIWYFDSNSYFLDAYEEYLDTTTENYKNGIFEFDCTNQINHAKKVLGLNDNILNTIFGTGLSCDETNIASQSVKNNLGVPYIRIYMKYATTSIDTSTYLLKNQGWLELNDDTNSKHINLYYPRKDNNKYYISFFNMTVPNNTIFYIRIDLGPMRAIDSSFKDDNLAPNAYSMMLTPKNNGHQCTYDITYWGSSSNTVNQLTSINSSSVSINTPWFLNEIYDDEDAKIAYGVNDLTNKTVYKIHKFGRIVPQTYIASSNCRKGSIGDGLIYSNSILDIYSSSPRAKISCALLTENDNNGLKTILHYTNTKSYTDPIPDDAFNYLTIDTTHNRDGYLGVLNDKWNYGDSIQNTDKASVMFATYRYTKGDTYVKMSGGTYVYIPVQDGDTVIINHITSIDNNGESLGILSTDTGYGVYGGSASIYYYKDSIYRNILNNESLNTPAYCYNNVNVDGTTPKNDNSIMAKSSTTFLSILPVSLRESIPHAAKIGYTNQGEYYVSTIAFNKIWMPAHYEQVDLGINTSNNINVLYGYDTLTFNKNILCNGVTKVNNIDSLLPYYFLHSHKIAFPIYNNKKASCYYYVRDNRRRRTSLMAITPSGDIDGAVGFGNDNTGYNIKPCFCLGYYF